MDEEYTQFILNYWKEVEQLAEDVFYTKQDIIEWSKEENTNREALSALAKQTLCPPLSRDKVWVNMGGMFIKFKKEECKSMIRESRVELQKKIESSRKSLLPKTNKLKDAMGEEDCKGFDLKPLTSQELNRVTSRKL